MSCRPVHDSYVVYVLEMKLSLNIMISDNAVKDNVIMKIKASKIPAFRISLTTL